MSKHIVIVGGGIIGLCAAHYAARRGHRVTILERNSSERDGCSYGNAGMVVPSHIIPLAAPGVVALALKWMWNPESPLYIKPRLDWDLITWGLRFMRASNAKHVERMLRAAQHDESLLHETEVERLRQFFKTRAARKRKVTDERC